MVINIITEYLICLGDHSETPLLEVKNLCVDYITDNGDFNAVKSVSFNINQGEIFGLAANLGAEKVPSRLPLTAPYAARFHLAEKLYSTGKICSVCLTTT